ncbi:T9SS type A sorting domain-containing protein [Aureispira sp. CCB-QB1]|uniref:Ig-like domain-containing protein n=1 Tax=Aureispira sp. CCB-QB1 TaxID=1313421 RepID=UPI0006968725|nr:T9SS type A sorting domain-containing protein [Aureispira sp. CCB-QB1]
MKYLFTFPIVCLSFLISTHLVGQTIDDLAEKNYNQQATDLSILQQVNTHQPNHARTAPPAPAATGDNLCAPGMTATLTATASSGGTLDWYNVASGGTSIGTGATFNPVVTSTSNYWVEEVVGGGAGGSNNLVAPYNSNNGQRGCMFDLTAANTVTINSFDANLYAGTTANYEIYYRAGTHVGSENNAGAWTLLGGATGITSVGNNLPTSLPIPVGVTIPAGQTYSFYITNDFGGGTSYTDGTAVGNFLASDANLTIYEGVGKSYPFGLTFAVRNFNGTIHYSTGGGSCSSPRTLVTANVKEPTYAPTNMLTSSNASCTVTESGVDWTYYYNTANPNDLLFAIAHDPMNLGNNNFTAQAHIQVRNNSTTNCYTRENIPQQLARFVMGRYWNVDVLSGNIVDPVWVRFYYQAAERTAMNAAAAAWQGTNGGVQSPVYFFKTNGAPFSIASSLHSEGVYNSLELTNFVDNQAASNGTNYVEIHDINSFSGGGLITGVVPVGGTTTGTAILLDLKLLDFSAKRVAQSVDLTWQTKDEYNMSHFELQRSLDGVHFETIAHTSAQAKGQANHYTWKDEVPYLGRNYYRLGMVEIGGEVRYSDVRVVSLEDVTPYTMRVAPNPFGDALTIEVYTNSSEVTPTSILVYNALGQQVYAAEKVLQGGQERIQVATADDWQTGCYTVVLRSNQFTQQKQVIKQ